MRIAAWVGPAAFLGFLALVSLPWSLLHFTSGGTRPRTESPCLTSADTDQLQQFLLRGPVETKQTRDHVLVLQAQQASILAIRVAELEEELEEKNKRTADLEAGLRMSKQLFTKKVQDEMAASLVLAQQSHDGDTFARERVCLLLNNAIEAADCATGAQVPDIPKTE